MGEGIESEGVKMYKITYIPTGHTFELPDLTAHELKEKFPEDYKILEKNGKKYRDRVKKKTLSHNGSIYEQVIDKKGGSNEILG